MSSSISDLYGVNSPKTVNAVYDNSGASELGLDDFFTLMIAELKNQDFTNPVDSSQYVTQLAQFATMQQMQNLAYYSKTNYVMGLIGKDVTVAKLSLGGNINAKSGPVEKITLSGEDYEIYVDGTAYSLREIMSVNAPEVTTEQELKAVSNMTPYLLKRTDSSAEIAWNAPTSSDEAQYYYSVYYSEDEEFDSVSQVKQGTLVASLKGGTDALEASLTDLEPDTTYYANVIISTSEGDEAAYQKLIFTTKDS
ncbi:flagellar hook capping FlgD N-terminal domain-containing protein [Oscillospiraceae bacterium LTW-04]|nr:flagellar hook capping FlgD N-terminal domain-containing protein [Oscillospiraceae bacterium MB24-C1]